MELNLVTRCLVVNIDKRHADTEASSSGQPLHSERFQNPPTVHSNCDVQLATGQLLTPSDSILLQQPLATRTLR